MTDSTLFTCLVEVPWTATDEQAAEIILAMARQTAITAPPAQTVRVNILGKKPSIRMAPLLGNPMLTLVNFNGGSPIFSINR